MKSIQVLRKIYPERSAKEKPGVEPQPG